MSAWGPQGPLTPEPPNDGVPNRLTPVPFGTLLSLTWRIYRRHWRLLTALALLFLLPPVLVAGLIGLLAYERFPVLEPGVTRTTFTPEELRAFAEGILIILGTGLATGIFNAVATVSFAQVVADDYHGRRPTLRSAGRQALRRALAAAGTYLLLLVGISALVTGGIFLGVALLLAGGVEPGTGGIGAFLALLAGVAFFVLVVLVSLRWALSGVVVALEPVGPLHALVRSWRLSAGAAWRTMGLLIVISLVVGIVSAFASELISILIADVALGTPRFSGTGLVVRTIVAAITYLPFLSIGPVALTVLYFDQRVRREGFDLPVTEAEPVAGSGPTES